MRLWSLHPCYLDARGVVALWREALLARTVLAYQTKGYRNHPQLERFKAQANPIAAIDCYLQQVYAEVCRRHYHFDAEKIGPKQRCAKISVTKGQLRYEMAHLQTKLKGRDAAQYRKNLIVKVFKPHPLFKVQARRLGTLGTPDKA